MVGLVDGFVLGSALGRTEGDIEGLELGPVLGVTDGVVLGDMLGRALGDRVGNELGCIYTATRSQYNADSL